MAHSVTALVLARHREGRLNSSACVTEGWMHRWCAGWYWLHVPLYCSATQYDRWCESTQLSVPGLARRCVAVQFTAPLLTGV
jgi:hypothetical protein